MVSRLFPQGVESNGCGGGGGGVWKPGVVGKVLMRLRNRSFNPGQRQESEDERERCQVHLKQLYQKKDWIQV